MDSRALGEVSPGFDAAAIALRRAPSSQVCSDSHRPHRSPRVVGASTGGMRTPSACIHALPPISYHRIASRIESDGRNTSLYSFRVSYVHRVAIDAYVRLLLSLGHRRREQEGKKELELREALEPALGIPATTAEQTHSPSLQIPCAKHHDGNRSGIDLYPPFENTASDNEEWVSFLEDVIARAAPEAPAQGVPVPLLQLQGVWAACREGGQGSAGGGDNSRYFGDRVVPWDEHCDGQGAYGWDEVYAAAEL
ncbi:hypothetical protein DFH09DRAFT_1316507 [Mycena vulgaris]|nr:hypothetical protein DFH09DRAFT_1316507 [Mycena vulgaris]